MSEQTFGQRARELSSAAGLVLLEQNADRSGLFEGVDVVVSGLLIRALRGERVLRVTRTDRGDQFEIVGIPKTLRKAMHDAFQLEAQQSRGAWFLPETVPINPQSLLYPALLREAPRYPRTIAMEEKCKVSLTGNPDAMVAWSALQPLCDCLLGSVFLRVEKAGLLSRDDFTGRWNEIIDSVSALNLNVDAELSPFAWAGGWATYDINTQLQAKMRLVNAIAEQLSIEDVRRFRACKTASLIAQYYAKAKNGRAKRKQVITKEHARTLAAYFGGDWLAFVEYLGEIPHEDERIATALPEPKVLVSGIDKAAQIAAKNSLPVAEVEKILGSYWQDTEGRSPVLERVNVLEEFWRHFDAVHTRQSPGMRSLWGFVEDGGWGKLEPAPQTPYQADLYLELLPGDLVRRIESLWGTTVLAKWPECLVSEPFPHSVMAETFGPALKFWHGVALTAWFVCEGPMSRTDIPGMAEYYRREVVALEDMGCPVPPQLFRELKTVRLGPEEPTHTQKERVEATHGISFEIQTSSGSRRRGFEKLRDIVSRHRESWTSQYLRGYLRALWETELRTAARQFHVLTEDKGKPPTVKQYAKHAIEPTRHWFGGDLTLLYAALGQKFSAAGRRTLCMPSNRILFVNAVFEKLGGRHIEQRVIETSQVNGQDQTRAQDSYNKLRRLAAESLSFVQLVEALGRPPTLKEFGTKFEWQSKALSDDIDVAWASYASVVERVIADQL